MVTWWCSDVANKHGHKHARARSHQASNCICWFKSSNLPGPCRLQYRLLPKLRFFSCSFFSPSPFKFQNPHGFIPCLFNIAMENGPQTWWFSSPLSGKLPEYGFPCWQLGQNACHRRPCWSALPWAPRQPVPSAGSSRVCSWRRRGEA